MSRIRPTKLTILTLVTAGLGLLLSLATAHPRLAQFGATAVPAPGAVLTASPPQVRLEFEGAGGGLDPKRSFIWVIKVEGAEIVDLGNAHVDLDVADRNVLVVGLPQLEPGLYTVKWIAISLDDNGFSEGSYPFAIVAAAN